MKMMPEFPFAVPDRLLSIADLLAEQGWAVAESGLAPEVLDQLERNCRALWQDEALRPAAVGRAGERQVVPEIRGDHIRWLDDCPPCAAQDAYVEAMARLRLTLNRTLLLGLDNYETHYALYPLGAGYSRHLDRFKDNPPQGVVLEPVQMPAVTGPRGVQGVMGLVIVQTQQQGAVEGQTQSGHGLDVGVLGGTGRAVIQPADMVPADLRHHLTLTGPAHGGRAQGLILPKGPTVAFQLVEHLGGEAALGHRPALLGQQIGNRQQTVWHRKGELGHHLHTQIGTGKALADGRRSTEKTHRTGRRPV